ncbi:peptidoglycan glycosyltransferase [Lysinibacillus contaminans]|uniref:Peptidoglycan glycosyltransferase n=1 Tax=Lysinibacillus contaminans TaxID=1293441 RepID=A0ABR5JYR4_9BACI|nr:transglycosylase domain-containing protein [Lysinibacillus contaminans]KOS67621.1 peptidoglycan glycosyltransferase [Lysinibacillus contaminans]
MKDWIEKINAKIDELLEQKWMKTLRISGSVTWNLFLLFLIFVLVGLVFVGSVGAGYFASLVKDEPLRSKEELRELIFNYDETSEIYFANDVYIGKLRTDLDRRETSLSSVSPNVINAVLATEDEYFREHNGIVPKAVFRGLLQDVTNSSTQTGGSTLTQQLIKNQVLTNEVSYERKAKELLLAMRLEHFMTKEEILEAYLNIIPYGRNASGRNIAGIETAADGIFGVKAKDLTLPQAAYIAGIPQAPYAYTPFTNKGVLKSAEALQPGIDRMKTVLYRMKEAGYIDDTEYKTALEYDITADFREPELRPEDQYPWLTYELEGRAKEIIAEILAKEDGIDPERLKTEEKLKEKYMILADRDVRSKGYRIYSTINKDMYDAMRKTADNFKYYGQTYTSKGKDPVTGEEIDIEMPVQVGSILIENSTGRILSFLGGRDFQTEELNHATQAYRSNGSTMKPLLVYAPAIEYGVIGAGSPVVDVKFSLGGWSPSNYTESDERGIIPAREALASSQNLSALRLYYNILNKRPAQFLAQMDFSKLQPADYENLATGIGALEVGTTVEENTNAFATFANGGQFIDAYMIEKIEDLDGNIIYQHEVEPVQVFSPETSYIITDMMRDVLKSGTGTEANRTLKFSSDFAAKTGTSQNYNDVWLVGYNPNVSLGVWMGYDKQRSLYAFNNTYLQPSTRINKLWGTLMNAMYDVDTELIDAKTSFKAPKNVVTASFCGISGLAPSAACQSAGLVRSDLFNASVFLPSQPDDSFGSAGANVVTIQGKTYNAHPNTPAEFVKKGGLGLNPAFINRMLGKLGGNPSSLLPKNSSLSNSAVAAVDFPADGSAPATVTASLSGNTLSWTRSSNDVVGYRIYNVANGSSTLVNSVLESTQSVSVSSGGSYVVVAVDITGLSSAQSNVVSNGGESEPDNETEETPLPPTDGSNNGGGSNGTNNGNSNGSNNGNSNGSNNGNSNGSNNGNSNGDGNSGGSGSNGENNNGGVVPPIDIPTE